jgi:NADH-quinone oxidoreductase subunit J
MELILFTIFALIAVACAINMVMQSHPISSALSLVGVMASLAVLYLLLGGEFIATVQIIVYAGAVMVLFIFVIMLLNAGGEERLRGKSFMAQLIGVPSILVLAAILIFFVQRGFPNLTNIRFGDFQGGSAQSVGMALFTDYLLPFEVISVLILIAILGAVVLARKEMD